ncbi:YczE/YyaS/YitT family protein [Clostridium sp. Marseille-P2415]|uniref:YczE/YyaS/YitT family protein n=1 Tax=Clostridium sp. Marseille-P2415 TaxID=1805471 RepID=UPI00098875C4|nr:DUF6198 family protein [Clostridium sp. Marseille-P2415]
MYKINSNFVKRVLIYGAGLMSLAFGVAFSVNSGLGVSPVNSLPYVISLITGLDMGSCVTAVFSIYILVQILILRREFRLVNLTQLLFSGLFGYFVDMAKWVVGDFSIPTYFGKLLMLAVSILFVSAGVCLYMNAKLVYMPMEGLTHAIAEKLFKNKPFHDVKVRMDCLVVFLGIVLSFVFLGSVEGIREGTVICAVLVGKVMKPMQKVLVPLINRICF